jgi:hypothetical protein
MEIPDELIPRTRYCAIKHVLDDAHKCSALDQLSIRTINAVMKPAMMATVLRRPPSPAWEYFMKLFENGRNGSSILCREKKRFHSLPESIYTVLLCLFMMALLAPAYGQEFRGTIRGQITDISGAVVEGATISVVGPTQNYNAHSGTDGWFTIPFIQPATYAVTIKAKGYKTELRPGVVIDINSKVSLSVALQMGAATETVTVVASAGLTLNTEDASGGTIMDPEKVQQLPLNGRQAYMLLSLTPSSQFTQTQFGASGYSGTRGWDESNAYSINGQSGSFNQVFDVGPP